MRHSTLILLLGALVAQINAAPQLISMKDGKLQVDFMGFKAGVGIGGNPTGSGLGGILEANAETPFGQKAKAGLKGAATADGLGGNLYSGATAGGNVQAGAGIAGAVTKDKTAGSAVAQSQAGDFEAGAGIDGSSGFSYSGGSAFAVHKNVGLYPVETVEIEKPVYKEVKTEIKTETTNEVIPPPVGVQSGIESRFHVEAQAPPAVFVKEVYAEPPPTKVIHKEIVRYKPHRRHHFHKTAYIGGYIGGSGEVHPPPPPPPPPAVVYKSYHKNVEVRPATVYKTVEVQPTIQKRVDVDVSGGTGGYVEAGAGGGGGVQHSYTKQISVQRNPTFFADIFNIPISTLKAVGNFLGNTAASTNVSIQKTASVQADTDSPSSKHLSSSSSASETQVSVQTPPVSSFLDDIFAIPINTLGAVNKFLENNVPARKNIQITSPDGEAVVTKVRRGPHARRRANKQVVIVEEDVDSGLKESEQH